MPLIPENLTEFLHWFKDRTESYWNADHSQHDPDKAPAEWIRGARWLPLTDAQIEAVEARYGITFPPEHREFLRVLHAIDRQERIEYKANHKLGEEMMRVMLRPFFYNWLQDHDEIERYLKWPYDTLLWAIRTPHKWWMKSWGPRPNAEADRIPIFEAWYAKAPKLIPIKSHRFTVSAKEMNHHPVLSMYGPDTIVYGGDMRSYLLAEECSHAIGYDYNYDAETQVYTSIWEDKIERHGKRDYWNDPDQHIPYWGELIN